MNTRLKVLLCVLAITIVLSIVFYVMSKQVAPGGGDHELIPKGTAGSIEAVTSPDGEEPTMTIQPGKEIFITEDLNSINLSGIDFSLSNKRFVTLDVDKAIHPNVSWASRGIDNEDYATLLKSIIYLKQVDNPDYMAVMPYPDELESLEYPVYFYTSKDCYTIYIAVTEAHVDDKNILARDNTYFVAVKYENGDELVLSE